MDYRGEVGIILYNTSRDEAIIKVGDKIAQGVIQHYWKADFNLVENLDETDRKGGFGSTN